MAPAAARHVRSHPLRGAVASAFGVRSTHTDSKEQPVTESGMPDMSALLEQARQMQERLLAAKDELASQVAEGTSAGGLVTARVNGTGELVGLDIKPEAVDPDDTETLA